MASNQIYFYGGVYPVQTSLVAPIQASTSTDLRDSSNQKSLMCGSPSLNHTTIHEDSELLGLPNESLILNTYQQFKKRISYNSEDSSATKCSSVVTNDSTRGEDSAMDFEIYHSTLLKNSFAPCPLQVPLEEDSFCPKATSTPATSPENSKNMSCYTNRTLVQKKPVKRKLQFGSEDEEAVFYLKTKYLNQED